RRGRLMIPIRKTVKMSSRISFRMPSPWREEMNFIQGNIAKIRIKNNSILINACNQYTTEVSSTIGEWVQIYITTEVRKNCRLKGIESFKVFIDVLNKYFNLKLFE